MRGNDGKLTSGALEGFRATKLIPLVISFPGGTPTVLRNPSNEPLTLSAPGGGVTRITLTNPGISPIIVPGISGIGATATLNAAPTSAVVDIVAGAATQVHLNVIKQETA